MWMITYKVVKIKGIEGTYNKLPEAQKRKKSLEKKYKGTKFDIKKMTNNNLYKYTEGEVIFNGQ